MSEIALGTDFETVFAKYNKKLEKGAGGSSLAAGPFGEGDDQVDYVDQTDSTYRSEIESVESAAYWGFEVDDFDMKHMYLSIVHRDHLSKLEAKMLFQANWSGKQKAKALTRLDSIRLGVIMSRASDISTIAAMQPKARGTGLMMPMSRGTGLRGLGSPAALMAP